MSLSQTHTDSVLLVLSGPLQWPAPGLPCPLDLVLAAACTSTRRCVCIYCR